jgi:putative glutamine amidotransferase
MRKPIIGIGADINTTSTGRERAFVHLNYVRAVERAGGVAVILPPQSDVVEVIGALDGLLLAGGRDCDPSLYGEEPHETVELMDPRRQSNELTLARAAFDCGLPVLGICLGLQVMNVARGGSLIQDIASEVPGCLQHESTSDDRGRHDIDVFEETLLAAIVGSGRKNVNTTHHQAVRNVGEGMRVTAKSADGIVEGAEHVRHPFFVGVQWHPEDMEGEEVATRLFVAFVAAARRFSEVRAGSTVS